MTKHKIGGHVLGSQRNGWGDIAPRLVCCISLEAGAFDELPDEAIKIFRTEAEPNHVDIAGDFDRVKDENLYEVGKYWWGELKKHYEPVQKRYKNVYFQPTNEVNNHRLAPYMRGMMEAAAKDKYRLALFGDAGDSPSWETWVEHWVPVLREGAALGHIYCRHAYAGVDPNHEPKSSYLTTEQGEPSDFNTGRPFREAAYLRDQGIPIPIIIGELGWHAGYQRPGYHWLEDLDRYNTLMLAHDNIIGGALWTWGRWNHYPGSNLEGEYTKQLAKWLHGYSPAFYDFSFKPAVVKTPEKKETGAPEKKVGQTGSEKVEKKEQSDSGQGKSPPGGAQRPDFEPPQTGISPVARRPAAGGLAAHLQSLLFQLAALGVHNPSILPLATSASGLLPLTSELRLTYGGQAYLVQLVYAPGGPEWRAYYSLLSKPGDVFVVTTGGTLAAGDRGAPPFEVQLRQVEQQPPLEADGEPAVGEPLTEDKEQHVIVEPAPPKPPEKIQLQKKDYKDGFVLEVPFRSQNGPGARKFGGDCGPTCTAMVIEAIQARSVNPDDLMLRLGKTSINPRENYTNLIHLEKVFSWYGIGAEYKKSATVDYIEENLAAGLPVVSLIHYGNLPDRSKAPISFAGWHYVVLVGFDENDFFSLDPLQPEAKISLINKKTFLKATEAREGVTNSQQVLIVRTDGLIARELWAEELPADIAFIPAIGERAEQMVIPSGDLVEAWVYTNAANPRLIRKGTLVEVKEEFLNVRALPRAKATREENGQTVEYDTKIGQVVPGSTMILTGAYENGYAQVRLILEKHDPTVKILPPVITGRSFDLSEYFLGTRQNVQWEIWSSRGQESLEIQKQGDADFRLVKNVNAEQMHLVTSHGRRFIARTFDSSHGHETYYTLQDGDNPYSLWCPLTMRLGEMYLRRPHVRVYKKSGEAISQPAEAPSHLKLVEHFDVFRGYDWAIKWGWPKEELKRIGDNIELRDCLLIEWVEGGEQYVLSRELGYFVAWARTHNDPNSPPFSVIAEINTGRSPLKPNPVHLSPVVSTFLQKRGIV